MTVIHLSTVGSSFELTSESDRAGDYLVAVEAESDGFKGHADGHVAGASWQNFCAALITLEQCRKGEATLDSAMPGEFSLRIGALNSTGHMSVTGVLAFSREAWPRQILNFAFEFDPSQLVAVRLAVQSDATNIGGSALKSGC